MPSFLLSSPSELDELKKLKHKKSKKTVSMAAELDQNGCVEEEKKSKKKKKNKNLESEDGEIDNRDSEGTEKKISKKKRKASDEERSDTISNVAPANGSASKKPKLTKKDEDGEVIASGEDKGAANPNAVSKFRISKVLREKLKSKGIESLFPIQAMTFDSILDGSDLVGRARTGQGKTLAFVLPILESLTNGQYKADRKTGHGRPPSVLVLLPTRELANQVYADFQVYGGAVGLSSCCLYGGSPYRAQELALKRGIDIVVGTPGRIKDHIERGTLDLKFLKFRILDEADEMLNMGFVDDVELILGQVKDVTKVQTLLFSATLPDWVKKISARFLKPDKKTADLVGNEKLKASASVRHLVLPCNTGVAILLYEPRYSNSISRLERESGVKFEHISAPQPADVAESAGSDAAKAISNVSDSVIPVFQSQAEQLLSSSGLSAVHLLAKALAKAAGYTDIKKRSLLSSIENHVTLLLQAGKTICSPGFAFSILREILPNEKIEGVKGLSLTADGMGAVFDVPADDVNAFTEGQENANMATIDVLKSLPPLQCKDQSRGDTRRGRFGGGRFSGARGGNGSSGRRNGGGPGKGNGGGRNRFNSRSVLPVNLPTACHSKMGL
ncbi:hypothetical protein COCNU_08G006200 [Cocos nucifera]|uniref:DEAD-box ATP-dependent RNA helicase 7 n=1 Tax=Cocos nucifera TaxID=13894 RepID=A0A8K0N6D7_COCNU|nr:hypothetical protein COCNU_08G006200 [Cocos nucifera]